VNGAIVTCEVHDEGATDTGCDLFVGKKPHYIEEITRMYFSMTAMPRKTTAATML
jgi:hypothetical protein